MRSVHSSTGIELPADGGWLVRVRRAPNDAYTVQRVRLVDGVETEHSERSGVAGSDVGFEVWPGVPAIRTETEELVLDWRTAHGAVTDLDVPRNADELDEL